MSAEPQMLPFVRDRRRKVQHAARDFHLKHPEVLEVIIEIAREAKANRGYRKWSISGVFEILRYAKKYRELRQRLGVADGEKFMLNNSHRSFYSRKAMEAAPDLEGFFETRILRSE